MRMQDLSAVLDALQRIRAPKTITEYDLHALVAAALAAAGLCYRHEAPIASRRRIDYLCGAIGIEIKRGRPAATPLLRQLLAYAACDAIDAIVLVADRPPHLPQTLHNKPLAVVSLQRLWGIAL